MLRPTPLHRQRKGRRRTVTVMNQAELARHFRCGEAAVREALIAAGWPFHEDANGGLWAVAPDRTETGGADPDQPGSIR